MKIKIERAAPRGITRTRVLRALAVLAHVDVRSPTEVERAKAEAKRANAKAARLAEEAQELEANLDEVREQVAAQREDQRWKAPARPLPAPEHAHQRLLIVYQADTSVDPTVEEWVPFMDTLSWAGPTGTLYARKLTVQLDGPSHHYPEPLVECVRWRVIDLPTLHTPF